MWVVRVSLKEIRLEAEAALSAAVNGAGFLHYGYWPEGPPAVPSLRALGDAQAAYLDRLVAAFPPGVRRILDVGSGTGANAAELIRRGFAVECLSPSAAMNAVARARLPPGTPVHETGFERFQGAGPYDLCLFAESFHYIPLGAALDQVLRLSGGAAVIFDYFRRPGHRGRGRGGDATRGTHRDFLDAVADRPGLALDSDEDLTAAILPTFAVLDALKNDHLLPLAARLRAAFRAERPVAAFLLDLLLGRRIDRLMRPGRRAETFAERFEYRLIRLRPAPT